jgi:hypothetical protein
MLYAMRRLTHIAAVGCAAAVAACGSGYHAHNDSLVVSQVTGRVLTCVNFGACDRRGDRVTSVVVFGRSHRVVISTSVSADKGTYSVSLPQGNYEIVAKIANVLVARRSVHVRPDVKSRYVVNVPQGF